MPSFSRVRLTGRDDCSTSRMISSFSDAEYLIPRPPSAIAYHDCSAHPRACFFEQTVFKRQFGHDLLQGAGLAAQVLHLVRGCCARRIASQPLLAGFEKVLRPTIIKILDNPLTTAELSDALLAPQALQHDTDLFFGRELPPRHAADVLHNLFRRFPHRPGFLSCLMRNRRPCVTGAAARHPKYAGQRRGRIGFVLVAWTVDECDCPRLFFRPERIHGLWARMTRQGREKALISRKKPWPLIGCQITR